MNFVRAVGRRRLRGPAAMLTLFRLTVERYAGVWLLSHANSRWYSGQYLIPATPAGPSQRQVCRSALLRPKGFLTLWPAAGLRAEVAGCLSAWFFPWSQQQVRMKKRGTEYQPKIIKRLRTHGWLKRISTRGGIEVILRRMLKGRKSLTH